MAEWIGGRNPAYEVLRAGRRQILGLYLAHGVREKGRLEDILDLCSRKNVPVEWAPRHQLDSLHSSHQGVALQVGPYPYSDLGEILALAEERSEPPFVLILDTLQDPQNLGTLLRTAEIVGVHGVLLPYRRTATVTPAVVNASSGASEHLLIAQTNLARAIAELKDAGVWVVGLEGGSQSSHPEQIRLDGPLALVVGNEGQGMRRLVSESCDLLLRLPMRGQIQSLNAAVAGSVALYMAWGARGYSGRDNP
jgi:23S rRNA (guanosine2251-2'-O)-methyltransferase